jgi:hypothetical protein
LVLPVVPLRGTANGALPKDEATFAPSETRTEVYSLSPDEPVWEIIHDMLGDRTGLRTHTSTTSRVSPTTEVLNDRQLVVWASNRNPADVVATGQHRRRITRSDSVITVDTVCTVRSTETAFHTTIDLYITVNGMPHHQKRWVRTFPRVLL